MKVLIDTNAFLRWTAGSPLPRPVERILTKRDTERFVSVVSAWEIIMKPQLHRSAGDIDAGIAAIEAALLPLKFKHLSELSDLPLYKDHRDPFDRMLIAQALSEELAMISADTRFPSYKRLRVIWD